MSRAAAILWVSCRDRAVVAGALAAIVALAWAYILLGAGMDTGHEYGHGRRHDAHAVDPRHLPR
jgi:predicted metal-binding membrane protein